MVGPISVKFAYSTHSGTCFLKDMQIKWLLLFWYKIHFVQLGRFMGKLNHKSNIIPQTGNKYTVCY